MQQGREAGPNGLQLIAKLKQGKTSQDIGHQLAMSK